LKTDNYTNTLFFLSSKLGELMAEGEQNPSNVEQSEMTNNATINSIADTSGVPTDDDNSLQFSDELLVKGNAALNDGDYPEASELFSRALEIRVTHYGELAPECVKLYYKFGLALLGKAQEEADPLGAMPKKDAESQQSSVKIDSAKNTVERSSSITSISSKATKCSSSSQQPSTVDDPVIAPSKSEDEKDDESDTEEPDEDEEDESDLDLAWKMLDLARAISEKHSKETLDMVDILSALAEVSLEREDIETSLSDYQKALSILECLVESDSRRLAELNFRICLCLEVGSKAEEAIPYCQKAVSVCKLRMQRLMDEMKSASASTTTSATSATVEDGAHSSVASQPANSTSDIKAEIETLTSLSGDLEKKASASSSSPLPHLSHKCRSNKIDLNQIGQQSLLEDLQQLVSNPSSILSDILGLVAAAKAKTNDQVAASSSRMGVATNNNTSFDSSTVSTGHTNGSSGVTHLGVVGRGVKRVVMNTAGVESSSSKRPALDPKPDGDGSPAS
ncbi:hypothetical protein KSS87_019813, partial [Heliosperma pusillum]